MKSDNTLLKNGNPPEEQPIPDYPEKLPKQPNEPLPPKEPITPTPQEPITPQPKEPITQPPKK